MTEHEPKRPDEQPSIEDEGFSDEPVAIPEPPPAAAPTEPAPPVPDPPETLAPLSDLGLVGNPAPPAAESAQAMEERMRRIEDALATLVEKQQAEPAARTKGALDDAADLLSTAKKAMKAKDRAEKAFRSAAAATENERWVLTESFAELRDIFTMYVDRRYQVSWAAWTFPSVAFLAMFLFYFTLGAVPIFGVFLDKIADLCLAFVVYKIVRRESIIYRETIAAEEEAEK